MTATVTNEAAAATTPHLQQLQHVQRALFRATDSAETADSHLLRRQAACELELELLRAQLNPVAASAKASLIHALNSPCLIRPSLLAAALKPPLEDQSQDQKRLSIAVSQQLEARHRKKHLTLPLTPAVASIEQLLNLPAVSLQSTLCAPQSIDWMSQIFSAGIHPKEQQQQQQKQQPARDTVLSQPSSSQGNPDAYRFRVSTTPTTSQINKSNDMRPMSPQPSRQHTLDYNDNRNAPSLSAPTKTNDFITARSKLVSDNIKAGKPDPYAGTGSGNASGTGGSYNGGQPPARSIGLSKRPKFIPPLVGNRQDANGGDPQAQRSSSAPKQQEPAEPVDERLRNIDPEMIETIRNEIIDSVQTVEWDDIAGLEHAKKTIMEIVVWPMLRPDIFTGLRGPPKGLLLFGPPGTGKTLIGKCIASQSKATFFNISSSSLTSKWVGDGEKMVRALFAVARVHQPSVIFVDEIDSLLTQRTEGEVEATRRIKTEFLVQFDGCGTTSEDRILMIGATNRPQEIDEAARRRFRKKLYIPLPEATARRSIVCTLMAKQSHSLTDEDIDNIVALTEGYSGSDMDGLIREAALGPIRDIRDISKVSALDVRPILYRDFTDALTQVRASVSEKDLEFYLSFDRDAEPSLSHSRTLALSHSRTLAQTHAYTGKTTLSDSLLSSNGIISAKLSGKIRYLDSTPEEQDRGITMKSSGISLLFNLVQHIRSQDPSSEPITRTKEYLINLIDSPGHVDFSSEVSTASRLCDGGLVLIDVVEGICTQTHTVLRQAWAEKVRPILVLNKIDRLIIELKMTPLEAYAQLIKILEQTNAILGGFYAEERLEDATKRYEAEVASRDDLTVDVGLESSDQHQQSDTVDVDDSDLYFAPERGNVIFASAIDGWAFRVSQFAQLYAAKLGTKESLLTKVLWGDFYLDTKAKKVVGRKGLKGRQLKPMFVQFALENIWAVYQSTLIEPDREKVEKIVKALNIKILPRDLKSKDLRGLAQNVMSQWLPLSRSVLLAVVQHVPSPLAAQAIRMPQILHPELKSHTNTAAAIEAINATLSPERTRLDQAIYTCSTDPSAPIVAYVSKMFGISRDLLPSQQKTTGLTPDEIRQRRQEIIAKSQALDREKMIAGVADIDIASTSAALPIRPSQAASAPAHSEADEVLIGFARIYSGTISVGQKIRVLAPKYDPNAPDADQHISEATVERLFLIMGRELQDLDSVPAGNVFGIMGLQNCVLKNATICSTQECPSLAGVRLEAAPIVRVALEPNDPTHLPQLIEGLKLLNRADPCVQVEFQDSGENVIVCAGELHLERCLKDLRERFARIAIQASPPIVPYRETLSIFPSINQQRQSDNDSNAAANQTIQQLADAPTGTVLITTKSKICTIRLRAIPLPPSVRSFLSSETVSKNIQTLVDATKDNDALQRGKDAEAFVAALKAEFAEAVRDGDGVISKVDWDSIVDRIVAFGPKGVGSNILACTSTSYEMSRWTLSFGKKERRRQPTDEDSTRHFGDYENSIVSGFQMATMAGPLCAEPMSGVCFVIEDVRVDIPTDDSEEVLASKMAALPAPTDILGKVYAVLNRRRGRIISEDMKEGTPFFLISSVMPVVESFGFADEIRKKTSGAASPQLLFTGFEVLDQDPFWVPMTEEELEDLGEKSDRENLAKKYVESVRKRKGLAIEKKVVEHAEKQKTLKNK
eukprot:jgi/Hompol1/4795/HPOL_001844-RA